MLGYKTSLAVALSIAVWIWVTLKDKWNSMLKRETTFLWKDQILKVQLKEQSVQRNLSNYKKYNQSAQSKQKRRKLFSLRRTMTSNLVSNYKISLLGFLWYLDVQMLIRKDITNQSNQLSKNLNTRNPQISNQKIRMYLLETHQRSRSRSYQKKRWSALHKVWVKLWPTKHSLLK